MDGIDYDFCFKHFGFTRQESDHWFSQDRLPDYRTPNPAFSPISYLVLNSDISKAQLHPVQHYLKHGLKENRPWQRPTSYRPFRHRGASQELLNTKIALSLHIFYPQYISVFISIIAQVQGEMDLTILVSLPTHLLDECTAAFATNLPGLRVICKASHNRGRNLAPLFTTFTEELSKYDVIFHCHSKLSEYSGYQQIEWATYLISAIIGTTQTLRSHVDLIATGQCDLIAPVPFLGISPIANHSLSNDISLLKLQNQLGLQPEVGFMTYPIGGMFVASRSLFERLANLRLSVEDFPTEPSSPDGELHHAIERLLGSLAGDRLAFFDQTTHSYCNRDSVLQKELLRFSPLDDLDEAISQHDTVCFDFFDTLCYRCSGDEEWAKKRVDHLFQCPFRKARNNAEAISRARLEEGRDVGLSEICSVISTSPLQEPLRLLAAERTIDLTDVRPIARTTQSYTLAIARGKTVIIVSDTYYSSDFITTFLKVNGLPQPSAILASSEVGARKDRGDMWNIVLQRFTGNVIHIGDNVRSDIQAASDRGITTFYVKHWRDALLRSNGLSDEVNTRNRHNSCFNSLSEGVVALPPLSGGVSLIPPKTARETTEP